MEPSGSVPWIWKVDTDKWKSALQTKRRQHLTRSRLWQFTGMPFRLCNAPATFERLMKIVLHGLIGKIWLVYLDDVVVFGLTVEELLQRLNIVFEKLRGAAWKLSPKKCQLFQKEVRYFVFLMQELHWNCHPRNANYSRRKFAILCSWCHCFVAGTKGCAWS